MTAHKNDDELQDKYWVARYAHSRRDLTGHNETSRRRRSESRPNQNESIDRDVKYPLGGRMMNEWRNTSSSMQGQSVQPSDDPFDKYFDLEDIDSCPNVTVRIASSRRFRRMFAWLLIASIGFVLLWTQIIGPRLAADWIFKEGFLRVSKGTYGFGKAGDFYPPERRVVELDKNLVPGGDMNSLNERRLIFIGDIHGCKDELIALLEKVDFDEAKDHLITTGDVISKGPDSPGVIDELIRLKATSVRGNHEDRILSIADTKTEESKLMPALTKGSSKDHKLLKTLKIRHLKYLRNTPLILRIPPLPQALLSDSKHTNKHLISSEILVVHAGLVPAVPLTHQDPYYAMNMRSLKRRTHVPSVSPASKADDTLPWIDLWDWYQKRLAKGSTIQGWHRLESDPEVDVAAISFLERLQSFSLRSRTKHNPKPKSQIVIYGHDSRAGLVIKRWTKGLDSSCVRGGHLTALVLDAQGSSELHNVKCEEYDK